MKLNLINIEDSDIKYTIFSFPDGEKQISIDSEIDRKKEIMVICRITNAEELFILMQVNDILSRHEVKWFLYITYLMSMRMDRVMDFNRPFSLKIVSNILKNFSCYDAEVLEPHSDKTVDLMGSYGNYFLCTSDCDYYFPEDSTIIYPDEGSRERYQGFLNNGFYKKRGMITFNKKRNLKTGKIESFEIDYINLTSKNFVFVDDLCDGGGTFMGELKVLKEKYPDGKFTLIVCHAVNEQGLRKVLDKFDKVITSNSYKDWDKIIKSDKLIVEKAW